MKRKKYISRRQKTRRCLLALLLLAALFVASGVYRVLPSQAIGDAEALADCRPTDVVRRLGWARISHGGVNQVYLCGNEDVLLFAAAKFRLWQGWRTDTPGVVDCTKDSPLHAGIHIVWSSWNDISSPWYGSPEEYAKALEAGQHDVWRYYAYGRVNDYRAMSVRVQRTYETEAGREAVWETEIPRSQWIWKDGQPYFAEEIRSFETGEPWIEGDLSRYKAASMEWRIQLLDQEGGILYEKKVQDELTVLSG